MTVRQYLENEIRAPWWSTVMGLPFKLLGALRSNDEPAEGKNLTIFSLL